MKTLPVLLLAITSLLLTSCSVTVQPGPGIDVHAVGVSGDVLVNERLGVRGYPGATLVKQEQDEGSSKTTFETGASLDAVYAHFHSQLTSRGWQRYELNSKPNQVKAEYAMGGEELELKLDREGRSGRYRLELDLD
jgi:predicted small secreted protein